MWVLENFVGERLTLTALLAYFPQHPWGVLPLVCGVLSLWHKRYSLAALNGGTLLFWAWALMGVRWHQFPSAQGTVRVVTYNVSLRDSDARLLAREISAVHPDIICLQESRRAYPSERDGENNVGQLIWRRFPGWHLEEAGDTCILTRFPVRSSRSFPLRLTRKTLDVTVDTPRGPLRVLSTHISTAFSGQTRYNGLRQQIRGIIPNAQTAAQARLDQIEPLGAALDADSTTPLVLCGDFNTPPRGLFYRFLRSRLHDGFADAGNGLGQSFPARLPLLRIDYVWTRGATMTSIRVAPQGVSDHRMVVADVAPH